MAEENVEGTAPQVTPHEERAIEQGWVPKEQWQGDPEDWRPAKEFLDRGELFKKIDLQGRELKETKRTLDDLAKHHARVKETEYKRALDTLKAQKKEALIEGDPDKVIEIDEKIAEVREGNRATETPKVSAPDNSENNVIFQSWVEKNSWYNQNKAMRYFADRVGNELGAEGGRSPSDILRMVADEVKKNFPDKFKNPKRDEPGAVEGSTNRGTSGGKSSYTLSDDERRVMQRFVRTVPGMTEEKYIAELKRINGV